VSAPFLLGVRVFGGLEAEAVAAIMSITISSLVFVAALGILFSIGAKRSSNAAGAAIFMFILVTFGPTIAVWVYASARGISVPPPTWLFQLSAPIALGWVTRTVIAGTAMTQIRGMWLTDTGANLGAAAAVALLSTVRLRRAMLADASAGVPTSNRKRRRSRRDRRPDGRTPATTAVPGETGAMEAPETVEQHAAEEVYKERETFVGDHPVAWRECRTVLGGSRRNRWIIGGVVLVILVWLNYRVPPASDVGGHMMVVIIGSLLMLVQAAAGGAPTVAGEREAATWPALLTTTLTGFEILLGKALGAMRRLWFWLAAIVAQLCVGVLSGGLRPLVLVHVPLVLIGGAVFLSGTGVLFSLMFKKGVTAAVFNIGLAFAAWLGAPVLAMLGAEFFGSRTVSRHSTVLGWLSDSLWCINPMVLAGVAVDGAAGPDRRYDMPWGRVSAGVFTPLAMGATALGIVIGLGALIFASRLFNRFGGRSS
jgi:ABC-type transport system involved in multi-copper enzyme maturation permease subunit